MSILYKLYGRSELEQLTAYFSDASRQWLLEWVGKAVDVEKIQVQVSAFSEQSSIYDEETGYSYFNKDHEVSLYTRAGSLNALLAYVVRVDGKSSLVGLSDVSRSLVNDCLADYVDRTLSSTPEFDASASSINAMAVGAAPKSRPGDLVVRLEYKELLFEVVLAYASIKSLCKQRTDKVLFTPLVRPQDCDIEGGLRLKLRVGDAELDYGVISEVAIGDVIRLDSRIDEPLSVYTEDDQYVCQAYLGKRGNAKAAKIIVNQ